MKFRWRKQLRFGPLRVNLTRRGMSSVTWKFGPFSWNSRTRRSTIDTPGPGYLETGGDKREGR